MNVWRAIRVMLARHRNNVSIKHVNRIAAKYSDSPAGTLALMVAHVNKEPHEH